MSDMDAYKQVFLAESADFLQQLTDGLLKLEHEPRSADALESVFRGAHSLKGMAGAMGYERTAELTHAMEGLVDLVRRGLLAPDIEVIDLLLAAVDAVRSLIDDESIGSKQADETDTLAALESAIRAAMSLNAEQPAVSEESEARASGPIWDVAVVFDDDCALKSVRAHVVLKRLATLGSVVSVTPTIAQIEDGEVDRGIKVTLSSDQTQERIEQEVMNVAEVASATVTASTASEIDRATDTPPPVSASTVSGLVVERRAAPRIVRVPIERLDALVDLVGELVILRSRLENLASRDDDLAEAVGQLERISNDLRYEVMRARTVPVDNVFNRFPRMVRDLSRELGKEVRLEMSGMGIELDRNILDAITDPLVHLIRNSIDHGLELPEERVASGKSREGVVSLSAERERDNVVIVVADDGRGVDVERVWAKAVEADLVSDRERAEYDEQSVLQFIYTSGFSTVDTTTRVSGRGVGMDVVKDRIERLGGSIRLTTGPTGTMTSIRLPHTLAIVNALLVVAAGQRLAIPLSAVEEVLDVDSATLDTIDGREVLISRESGIVPVLDLGAMLFGGTSSEVKRECSIVLLRAGHDLRALRVGAISGRGEIVVKPLSSLLSETKGLSGAAVMGDGAVMLVVDPHSLGTE